MSSYQFRPTRSRAGPIEPGQDSLSAPLLSRSRAGRSRGPGREQHCDGDDEHEQTNPGPDVRDVRNKRAPQRLAHIGHRVRCGDHLEPAQPGERRPGVLAAPREQQRREDEREEQIDSTRLNERPKQQTEPGADKRAEQEPRSEERQPAPAPWNRAEDQYSDRDHEQRGSERAQHGEQNLLRGDEAGGHRREQPILDLARPAELGHERKGKRLHGGDHGGERDEPGEQQVGIAVLGVAEAAEHLAENEEQEERLEDDLGEKGRQLTPGDGKVTMEHCDEGPELARRGDCGHRLHVQRSVLPVRWMKTSSSVGAPSLTSVSARP